MTTIDLQIAAGLVETVALVMLVSGVDDLFIDLCYAARQLHRRLFPGRDPAVAASELAAEPEQAIAIMVPAWHEYDVIAKMLRNTLRTADYKNFAIFVGTYPNDEKTMNAVAEVAAEDPRVRRVVCPHDGPTCKADCLNWIIEAVRRCDRLEGRRFEIFMLHDSEDVIHPLSFKLINHYVPASPMVQMPVFSFPTGFTSMTASTYIDEFAELHTKDLLVRGALCGMVPCAGVGAGFSREIIDKIAEAYGGQVFNTATFTEDYDLAFRLKALGGTSYLLHHFIEREKIIKAGWLRPERRKVVRELVCTREFFPTRFRDAVKQKSRWTLGIVFHGWQQRGWEGGLALRYMIWRDRKSLLTNSINMLGYVLLALGVLDLDFGVVNAVGEFYRHMPSHHWLREVIDFNWLILLNRCAQRMVCTARIFSWREAALTVPKLVWANVINFCAVAKASYLFVLTTYMGRKLVWAKTDHVYPSDEELLGLHAQPVPEERHD